MNTSALRTSIWLVNIIIVTFMLLFILLISAYISSYYFDSSTLINIIDDEIISGDQPWKIQSKIIVSIIGTCLSLYLFRIIRKTLLKIMSTGPFTKEVISSLKKTFYWILAILTFNMIARLVIGYINDGITFTFDTTGLIILLLLSIIYVLIEIFTYGEYLHSEQKLTI